MKQYAQTVTDPVKKQSMLNMAERMEKVSVITGKHSNIIKMMATPLIALIFWLFYYRSKYNYIEHLVANMYFVGFIMIFYALLFFPLQQLLPKLSMVWLGLFFLFELIYRANAYSHFINDRSAKGILKAFLVSLFMSIVWFAATTGIIMWYIRSAG